MAGGRKKNSNRLVGTIEHWVSSPTARITLKLVGDEAFVFDDTSADRQPCFHSWRVSGKWRHQTTNAHRVLIEKMVEFCERMARGSGNENGNDDD